MDIIKYYQSEQVEQWLKEAGIDDKQANLFLKLFQLWNNTNKDLSIFNYSFLSSSYSTEVRIINNKYVIKGTQSEQIKHLQEKINYYIMDLSISPNIFLPIYCLELKKYHKFTDEFLKSREILCSKISQNSNKNPPRMPNLFNCLVIQKKIKRISDIIDQAKLNNFYFDINLHNLGLSNDELILFDW